MPQKDLVVFQRKNGRTYTACVIEEIELTEMNNLAEIYDFKRISPVYFAMLIPKEVEKNEQ